MSNNDQLVRAGFQKFAQERGLTDYFLQTVDGWTAAVRGRTFANKAKRDDSLRGHLRAAGFDDRTVTQVGELVQRIERDGLHPDGSLGAERSIVREEPQRTPPPPKPATPHQQFSKDVTWLLRNEPSAYWQAVSDPATDHAYREAVHQGAIDSGQPEAPTTAGPVAQPAAPAALTGGGDAAR
jgi:hypothetical protein